MNSICYFGYINSEFVKAFIQEFNQLDFENVITIYLNSEGGEVPASDILKDLLCRHGSLIELVASGNIMSCAFDLFYDCDVHSKRILPFTVGMIHQTGSELKVSADGKLHNPIDVIIKNQMRITDNRSINRLKYISLTDKEIVDYKAGEDVFFSTKRLNQILKDGKNKGR